VNIHTFSNYTNSGQFLQLQLLLAPPECLQVAQKNWSGEVNFLGLFPKMVRTNEIKQDFPYNSKFGSGISILSRYGVKCLSRLHIGSPDQFS